MKIKQALRQFLYSFTIKYQHEIYLKMLARDYKTEIFFDDNRPEYFGYKAIADRMLSTIIKELDKGQTVQCFVQGQAVVISYDDKGKIVIEKSDWYDMLGKVPALA